jgi:hypothetical protein
MAIPQTPSIAQLKRALEIAEQIQDLEIELAGILCLDAKPMGASRGASPVAFRTVGRLGKVKGAGKPAKRVVSLESRERMAEAARKRWAAKRQTQ